MAFTYLTIFFSIKITSSAYFPVLIDKVVKGDMNLLPVTVVAAILLFILRELFDLFKKRSDKKRNIEAIKLLIADEIEKNHWSLKSLFMALSCLKEDFEENDKAVHYLHIARNGSEHFRAKEAPEDRYSASQSIPNFHTSMYEKLIPDIAALDKKLFIEIHSTYEEINELIHYRDTMVDYLTGEDLAPSNEIIKIFLSAFADEENDYYEHLNKTYKLLKYKELTVWKLR